LGIERHDLTVAGGMKAAQRIDAVGGIEDARSIDVVVEAGAAQARQIGGLGQRQRSGHGELVVLDRERMEVVIRDPHRVNDRRVAARRPVVGEGPLHDLAGPVGAIGRRAPQHRVHHAAHGLPVFGVEGARDDLHLLEQRAVELQARLVVVHVVHRHAVHLVLHLAGAAAANVTVHHTGLQIDDVLQLLDRQLGDLGARHLGDVAGLSDVHHRGLRDHHDFLELDRTLLQLHVERGVLIGGDRELVHQHRPVADQSEAHPIDPRRNVENAVVTVGIGRGAERRAHQRHVGARKRLPLLVHHAAFQSAAGAGLRGCGIQQQESRAARQPASQRPPPFSIHHAVLPTTRGN
jgi:hypothetical protein